MDAHDLGADHRVRRRRQKAIADAESRAADDPAAISYLKEQQWTNGFATALVQEAEIRRGIRVPAVVEPLTGGEAIVAAPADGRFMAPGLVRLGTRVQAGQELGRIQPRLTDGRRRPRHAGVGRGRGAGLARGRPVRPGARGAAARRTRGARRAASRRRSAR